MRRVAAAALTLAMTLLSQPSAARTICTVIARPDTGAALLAEGTCDVRATPASTFKVALAVMAYDAGILTDAHSPAWPYRAGYVDWSGAAWRQPTDPAGWMKHSVVWYSQQIAIRLGAEGLARYGRAFSYGNADFSGDPGQDNGLERSWIASSLQISPDEQVAFLARLVSRTLPVSAQAMDKAASLLEQRALPDGWMLHGKTGGAYPRRADGSFDRTRGWGWFVGWAERDGRRVVFARLDQDESAGKGSPGPRTRDAFIADWSRLAGSIGAPAND
ncbi:class D beta-lactamase [Aquibium sp. ELW1220]|uniref:class D beta-lactamase n=1 Tax=Aquibium sp. ELW1220 TaxID=2976766 RepID=UPI0025B18BC7|nr:class D beta-lactamase [Aquibium sp. ELW1220]MDN2582861.1 class D beta-lactamase [Aquibium sp. ELW1220]